MAFTVVPGSQIPLRSYRVHIPLINVDGIYRSLIDAVQAHASWLATAPAAGLTGNFTEAISSSTMPDGEPFTTPMMVFGGTLQDPGVTDSTAMAGLNDLAETLAGALTADRAQVWYRDQVWLMRQT